MSEAVIVATARSPIGRANKGTLTTMRPDDMSAQIGVKVKPYFSSNYTSQIEAMRFKQVQVGWFSALPALDAVERADGEVLGRVIDAGGDATYKSVIIVRKDSGITLEKLLACGQKYTFGIGDPHATGEDKVDYAALGSIGALGRLRALRSVGAWGVLSVLGT